MGAHLWFQTNTSSITSTIFASLLFYVRPHYTNSNPKHILSFSLYSDSFHHTRKNTVPDAHPFFQILPWYPLEMTCFSSTVRAFKRSFISRTDLMSQFSNILSKLNIDQGGVDIPMKKKTVHVSGKEVVFFNKLFDIVDYDGDDRVCFDSSSLSSRSMERKVLNSCADLDWTTMCWVRFGSLLETVRTSLPSLVMAG